MTTDPQSLIAEAEAALEGVTRGPWTLDSHGFVVQPSHITRDVWPIPRLDEDCRFIAASRSLVPRLVAGVRELLRLAESYAKGFENVRLDLVNERNELGRRLALADAVINRIEADGGNSYQVRELVKAYRAAEVKP